MLQTETKTCTKVFLPFSRCENIEYKFFLSLFMQFSTYAVLKSQYYSEISCDPQLIFKDNSKHHFSEWKNMDITPCCSSKIGNILCVFKLCLVCLAFEGHHTTKMYKGAHRTQLPPWICSVSSSTISALMSLFDLLPQCNINRLLMEPRS